MTLVEQRRHRLKQAGDSLKRQLHCVEQRLDEQPGVVAEMRALYRRLERKQRPDFVVHWPHRTCDGTAGPMTLVPFSALPTQRGATNDEYVFYEFLLAQRLRSPAGSPCSRWPGESVISGAAGEPPCKKTRLPEPEPADDALHIRIVRWQDARTTGDFDDAAGASGPNAHFAEQRVSTQSHKLHAVALPPVAMLSLMDVVGGGSLQLGLLPDDAAEPHRLVLINCVLRLCAREHFRGLTLYLADQAEPVALDYDTLALAGRLDLDLRQLGAPNAPCRLVTRSPLTLLFPAEQACSGAVLRSAVPCRLALDGVATLQYVAARESDHAPPPYAYCIETDAWLPIPRVTGGTRMPQGGFSQAVEHYYALERMQVCFGAGPPRFTIDDETLPVVLSGGGDGMLVWRGRTLARFGWDGARLTLRLVLPEDSQSVNPLKYHVY